MNENPKDPLFRGGPPPAVALLRRFAQAASDGFSPEQVVDAAANLIVNAIRQGHSTRQSAERTWDAVAARVKAILIEEHYDVNGRKRGIFPYNQTIVMPHHFEPRE